MNNKNLQKVLYGLLFMMCGGLISVGITVLYTIANISVFGGIFVGGCVSTWLGFSIFKEVDTYGD